MQPQPFYRNIRPGFVTLIIPLGAILFLSWVFIHKPHTLIHQALPVHTGGDSLAEVIQKVEGITLKPGRQFGYYEVQRWQTPESLSQHFGVPLATLTSLNPGPIVAGVTIKIPPIESPFFEEPVTPLPSTLEITDKSGGVEVKENPKESFVTTDLPTLAAKLADKQILTKVNDTTWRIEKPLFITGNIRLQITKPSVQTLELKSGPSGIVCLCIENAEMLINGLTIRSFDPTTNSVDKNFTDERSFIRALGNSRMDILNSDISYLGNPYIPQRSELQSRGGAYGVSWKAPDKLVGKWIVTGWVENSNFHFNHFGSYMFGASGMTWRNNVFAHNDRYGLDPHDDSNNALIEGNRFEANGKHGFIVARRCNYNIIRNNISINNKLHGFILYQDSNFNVIENNIAYGNIDNVAIYQSNYNIVRNNQLSNPSGSNIRVNQGSNMTLISDNILKGGLRGIYAYGQANYVIVKNNSIDTDNIVLAGNSNLKNLVFIQNKVSSPTYRLKNTDNSIIEANITTAKKSSLLSKL